MMLSVGATRAFTGWFSGLIHGVVRFLFTSSIQALLSARTANPGSLLLACLEIHNCCLTG